MGFTEKSDFLRGEGLQELEVSSGGFDSFKVWEGSESGKIEGVFSLPHFGRQGACHDITKSADS